MHEPYAAALSRWQERADQERVRRSGLWAV